ncbi:MAG: tetratricopeptide repeat protein, partial [Gemmatimonadetes bacterium]|nr:tetratricopeptide repeat protein [Gemmatimonadota bacterium]
MRNRPRQAVVATSFALIAIACSESTPPGADSAPVQVQAVSFLGDTLVAGPSSAAVEVQSPLLAAAREALEANPDDPEAWIWVGRRLGYLQEYREAIDVYSQAIQRFPDDPRLYRHRGHRYISVR